MASSSGNVGLSNQTGSSNQIIGNQRLHQLNSTIIKRKIIIARRQFIVKSAFWSLFDQLVTAVRLVPMHMSQTQWLNIVYLEAKLGGRNRGWKRDENVALHNKDSFYLPYNRSVEFLLHPETEFQPRILEFKVRLGISGRSNCFQVETKKDLGFLSPPIYYEWPDDGYYF